MKENKEWFMTTELLHLPEMPSTVSGINYKAKSEKWIKRKPDGVKGRAFEYHISSLPLSTQKQILKQTPTEDVKIAVEQKLIKIPYYEVFASAGHGVLPFESDDPQYAIDIHPQILLNQGVVPKDLFSMPVRGDSMEPSLYEGDIVLVKRVKQPYSVLEGVFVIRIDHELFIKRIQFNRFESRLKVDSDNPYYDSYLIMGEDLNSIEIIGEAVCSLGKIRRQSISSSTDKLKQAL